MKDIFLKFILINQCIYRKNASVILGVILILCISEDLFSQVVAVGPGVKNGPVKKPPLDTIALSHWLKVEDDLNITNDGRFVFYSEKTGYKAKNVLVIRSIDNDWEKRIADTKSEQFSIDSRFMMCIKSSDTLEVVSLGTDQSMYFPGVTSYSISTCNNRQYLIYAENSGEKVMHVVELSGKTGTVLNAVGEFCVSSNGRIIAYIEKNGTNSVSSKVKLLDLDNMVTATIWTGSLVNGLRLNQDGSKVAFIGAGDSLPAGKTIFVYSKDGGVRKIEPELPLNTAIREIISFDKSGVGVFVKLVHLDEISPSVSNVHVDIWSYTDVNLQPWQLRNPGGREFLYYTRLDSCNTVRLQYDDEEVSGLKDSSGNLIFMVSSKGYINEEYWNRGVSSNLIAVSVKNGKRRVIDHFIPGTVQLSPAGNRLIGLDKQGQDYYCLNLDDQTLLNLTGDISIPVKQLDYRDRFDHPKHKNYRDLMFAGWIGDTAILVCDAYDIYRIDLSGRMRPVNLTNGFGRKNGISFRLINAGSLYGSAGDKPGSLVVASFDQNNKNAGFYSIDQLKSKNPSPLSSGKYSYSSWSGGSIAVKASNASVFVVKRESCTESSNYFSTSDFKQFSKLSDVKPELQFNWMTSDLYAFKTLDGRTVKGVLYKPENFDPARKYPVIISLYERKSQELNVFHAPSDPSDYLGVGWFVSREYLVFSPDIYYKIGYPGQSAVDAAVGAAHFLSTLPFVERRKIALHGHSFGAYEVNFIVTQTNIFAAAVSSSGVSDLISRYGTVSLTGFSQQERSETGQQRIGGSLWEKKELYIANSPLFYADRVNTPMLTIANKLDSNVPFQQGVEWYLALRRLGKKVWMLQYDGASHGLSGDNYLDYVLRINQFFEHYLKDKNAPKWMLEGVPAKLKGRDNGMKVDSMFMTPGRGLLKDKNQR